jgi:hypothetical protein
MRHRHAFRHRQPADLHADGHSHAVGDELLRLRTWIGFIPVSVISGFTKGIAVLILPSQAGDFFSLQSSQLPAEFFARVSVLRNSIYAFNGTAAGLEILHTLRSRFPNNGRTRRRAAASSAPPNSW